MPIPRETPSTDPGERKRALRRRLLEGRRTRPAAELEAAAAAIAGHALAWDPVRRARTVAAYVSVGPEPGTGPLVDGLRAAGIRVLVPVVLPDLDLDWAVHDGPGSLATARLGLQEPVGERLGREAVLEADVLLVPGLAVSPVGDRLGRGGGCYDRALARAAGRPTAVLLHDAEVGIDVPTEPHDRPVTHAITPAGVHALGS
ncbi:5-formyltetrahydrofolate cyclo-ligase [Nocardioides sediminis]|uniref:5-formyltetrahydrofolate cyclo-ligase n=1 Tax=Nocardioides sediminis TaxID=433648 RepID=UPI001F239A1F|nr:5-formyltetrahydrofolate cyclo-ligase [Nocardioides sediminis]